MTFKLERNPETDLTLDRIVDVPRELVWKAWTTPVMLKQWFTPVPWKTVDCSIDLRPGGLFHTVMQSPEGQQYPNSGCYLDVKENERLVWTDALVGNYRPSSSAPDMLGSYFTAMVLMADHDGGTRYTAHALHADAVARKKHEDMGFHDGWGTVLDQLVAFIKSRTT